MAIEMLPLDLSLNYLAEGAANVVYQLSSSLTSANIGEELDYNVKENLLRLQKDIPSRVPVKDLHQSFIDIIYGLFPSNHLVEQTLVKLQIDTIYRGNKQLLQDEQSGKRPMKRHGSYLAKESHGLLITNMSPNETKGEVLIEFKPKWLCQSPSAPKNAVRCRTCALRAQRERAQMEKESESPFCPLDLVANNMQKEKAIRAILYRKLKGAQVESLTSRVLGGLKATAILDRLRDLQAQFDPNGVLASNVESLDFKLATTLRDCTVFIKIPSDPTAPVDIRLGDLDLKSSKEGKADYWKETELRLIKEGWYSGTESEPREIIICLIND